MESRDIVDMRTENELLEGTILDRTLAVVQIGSLHDELRLILASAKTGLPEVTILLTGVAYYIYRPTPSTAIRHVHVGEPGSLAWRLDEQQISNYTQIQLDGLHALARSVSFRPYEPSRDAQFPV
jgi:hypothetical protein